METAAPDAFVVVSGCEQLGKGWRRHARQNVDRNRQGGSSLWDFRRTGQSTASQAQVPHSPARYAAGPRGVRPLPRNSNWRSAAVSSRGLHACTPQIGQFRLWGLIGLMCRRWQDLHQHSADSSRALQGRGNCRVCVWHWRHGPGLGNDEASCTIRLSQHAWCHVDHVLNSTQVARRLPPQA